MAAEPFERPLVLRIHMPHQVAVARFCNHAKKSLARRIPPVFHLNDGNQGLPEPQRSRRFIRLIARIACHLDNHGLYPLPSAVSAFHAAPRNTITAEICIQMSKPITAARPPYTTLYGTRRT